VAQNNEWALEIIAAVFKKLQIKNWSVCILLDVWINRGFKQ
jgi:hypothetical protein